MLWLSELPVGVLVLLELSELLPESSLFSSVFISSPISDAAFSPRRDLSSSSFLTRLATETVAFVSLLESRGIFFPAIPNLLKEVVLNCALSDLILTSRYSIPHAEFS